MVEIKYIGKHQPNNIIDVDENKAKELVATKQYVYVDKSEILEDKIEEPEKLEEESTEQEEVETKEE